MVRIQRVDVVRASNLVALICLVLTLIVAVPLGIGVLPLRTGGDLVQVAPAFVIGIVLMPVAAAVAAWILTAIACVAYNVAARVLRMGGRLTLSVWADPGRNPWATVAADIGGQLGYEAPGDPTAPGGRSARVDSLVGPGP